jgi:hypothetical protein
MLSEAKHLSRALPDLQIERFFAAFKIKGAGSYGW